MSGFQEILVIGLILAVVFFLPRAARRSSGRSVGSNQIRPLSGKRRLAVVLSIAWPGAWAVVLRPWETDPTPFLLAGVAPVLLIWGLAWVRAGFKDKRPR